MTLENLLRGSGEFGYSADTVYGVRCEDDGALRVRVQCLKPRSFTLAPPFQIQGRPCLDEHQDFGVLTGLDELEDARKSKLR
jgi:hypothetical protein